MHIHSQIMLAYFHGIYLDPVVNAENFSFCSKFVLALYIIYILGGIQKYVDKLIIFFVHYRIFMKTSHLNIHNLSTYK